MEGCAAARTEATRAANRDGGAKRRGELFAITKPRASTLRLGRRPKADQPSIRFAATSLQARSPPAFPKQARLFPPGPSSHLRARVGNDGGRRRPHLGAHGGSADHERGDGRAREGGSSRGRPRAVARRAVLRPRSGTAARPSELVSDASRPPPPPPVRTCSGDRVYGRHEQLHAHEGQPVDDERGGARDRPSASRSRKCIVVFGTAERSRRA